MELFSSNKEHFTWRKPNIFSGINSIELEPFFKTFNIEMEFVLLFDNIDNLRFIFESTLKSSKEHA